MRKNFTIGGDTSPGKGGIIFASGIFNEFSGKLVCQFSMIAVHLMVINGFCQITYCIWLMKKRIR